MTKILSEQLWPAQYFGFRGDKCITKRKSCLSCRKHPYWFLSMPLQNIIKIFQTLNKLWSAKEYGFEIYSGEITKKKQSKSFFSCMWHFALTWYMSPPNIIKLANTVWEIWPAQDFSFRGYKYIMNKVRVVSVARIMPTGPYLCLYQILSK